MILYLIQVAFVFSVLYLLYVLFLSKLTFHKLNRLVLVLIPIISLTIPFLSQLFPSYSSKLIEIPIFERANFEIIKQQFQSEEAPLLASSFSYTTLLFSMYWILFSLFIIRMFIQTKRLFALRNASIIEQKSGYQLITANIRDVFSYFNWVFVPMHKFEQYNPEIIEHEKQHVQLKHSWDVMLAELYIAFFWFNPLAYSYRKSLKSIHEFQADNGVLQSGTKTSSYMLLLKESLEVEKPNRLYNYFNQSLLKKRVMMMTKPKSKRLSKLGYIILLPICGLLFSAFASPLLEGNEFLEIIPSAKITTEPPSLFPVQNGDEDDITAFFGVSRKHFKGKETAHGGIDIKGKTGMAILSTADGVVNKASLEGNWGNLIIISHSDGFETWYAHLNGFKIKENQKVKKGDIIGYLGNSGLSTGPHLHYEVKQNGSRLNPLDYLK